MAWRIILWGSIIWLPLLLWVILKNDTKFKKNIVVGVTLPFEGREDRQVVDVLSRFRRRLAALCAGLTVIAVPCVFVRDFGVNMTLWCLWLILCIILPYAIYAMCNTALKKIKRARGWSGVPYGGIAPAVEIPEYRWMSPWLFALPLALSLLPLAWERELWLVCAVDALCIVLFWAVYRWMYRRRPEQVDEDTALTAALTSMRRRKWGGFWMMASYCVAALNFCLLLGTERPTLMLTAVMLVCLVLVIAAVGVEMSARRMQEKLSVGSGQGIYIDEDDKWIWGIFYYDPRDRHSIVNDRVGMGSTFNMARPAGKICVILTAALLIATPFIGPLVTAAADKPIGLEFDGTYLTASSGRTEYKLELDQITEAELLDSLPENMTRTNGTGLENLLKGRFRTPELGNMYVCLDPGSGPFILLGTEDGRHFLFGTRDPELTREIYDNITE